MKRAWTHPRYLLPIMICVGVLIIGMRIGDIWESVSSGRIFAHTAMAQTKAEAAKPEAAKPEAKTSDKAAAAPQVSPPSMGDKAPPPADDVSDKSPAELDVLKQLSQRREQLEKRARDLDTHEALLKVAEQRVDQKIKEMETLRGQLQTMVSQLGDAQQAQLDNLVKIYETMKPEEAARIFETLDMPVLMGVIQHMKPKSTAPIMAKMAPEKAKEITIALTRQDQLPKIK